MAQIRESGEDYLEAIFQLEGDSHQVRSIDVANRLGVSRPSVNKAIAALKEAGMVKQEPYGNICLTEKGRETARRITERHTTLYRFLVEVLEVDPLQAEADACRMEHIISEDTYQGFCRLLREGKSR